MKLILTGEEKHLIKDAISYYLNTGRIKSKDKKILAHIRDLLKD